MLYKLPSSKAPYFWKVSVMRFKAVLSLLLTLVPSFRSLGSEAPPHNPPSLEASTLVQASASDSEKNTTCPHCRSEGSLTTELELRSHSRISKTTVFQWKECSHCGYTSDCSPRQ